MLRALLPGRTCLFKKSTHPPQSFAVNVDFKTLWIRLGNLLLIKADAECVENMLSASLVNTILPKRKKKQQRKKQENQKGIRKQPERKQLYVASS